MLGNAPGTTLLNGWVNSINDGMSVEDIANHIASSDHFTATYPTFLTNEEFAESFLGNLMGDEDVPAATVAYAEDVVTGLLNDGMTRGALALAVVGAMYEIHEQGAAHAAYGDLGVVADGLFNKIEVAEHYTLEALMADPSSDVLDGVNSDDATAMAAIDGINNPPEVPIEGQTFVLTSIRDDIDGTPADDLIIAEPVAQVSNRFVETLNPFDDIDGGEGNDTIAIYGVEVGSTLSLGAEQVSNVENVILSTVGAIDADMSSWEGLEAVDLQRFGPDDNVRIIVDGATVSTEMTFGGDVTIAGAAGDLSIKAGGTSNVHVGSAGHTATVTVEGGGNVVIDNGAGKQSETVTSVTATGVAHNAGTTTQEPSGLYNAMTNDNGFVVGQDGSTPVMISHQAAAGDTSIDGDSAVTVSQVGLADDGVTLTNAITGAPITVTRDWDDDTDSDTDTVLVTVQLKFDQENGGLVFGDIVSVDSASFDADADPAVTEIEVRGGTDNAKDITAGDLDGMRVPAGVAFTSRAIGKEDAGTEDVTEGGGPTLTIDSDAIADLTLASTTATILVRNQSMTADEEPMPEDLSITVNKYGTKDVDGKLCVAGAGSAENITLTVSGDSWVDLNSNAVKMLDIDADAKLSLSVSKFDDAGMPDGASGTLAGVTISGEGAVSMNSLDGMKKLESIDASGSSGKNSFVSEAHLAALATVMGGSGDDTVSLVADEDGKLESISTGDGGDSVSISGDYREDGLMVDLGDGDDSFDGNAGNDKSRVDGGDGTDTLKLSADGATYKNADDKTVSIYSNFEVLDVGGGSGEYDVGRLGVDSIEIGESTDGTVTLDNVGAGTSLSVSAEKAGTGTVADLEYNLSDSVTGAGSILGGANNSILNVSLMARGGKDDSKAKDDQSGLASLTLTSEGGNIRAMIVDSNASVHGEAGSGTTSGHYVNTVNVAGISIEEVQITGNAQTMLTGSTALRYVTAATSGGGVTVDASASANTQTLIGSKQDDMLTAGGNTGFTADTANRLLGDDGDDTLVSGGAGLTILVGGAGQDTLTGDASVDLFVYNSHSESQLSFKKGEDDDGNTTYTAEGYDTIKDFASGETDAANSQFRDSLHFSEALHAIVTAGQVVGTEAISDGVKAATEWGHTIDDDDDGTDDDGGWMPVDHDDDDGTVTVPTISIDGDDDGTDGGAADLRDFIGSGKGLFLTSSPSPGGAFGTNPRSFKNSIAVIEQEMGSDGAEDEGDGIWLLFDIDGDGDFDAETDMVIFIAGDAAAFDPANDISV